MPQAVSSLPSIAKSDRAGHALLARSVVEVRLQRRLGLAEVGGGLRELDLGLLLLVRAGRRRLDRELRQGARPLERPPGPVSGQVRVVEELDAEGGDLRQDDLRRELRRVLGRGVALRQVGAVLLQQVLLAPGGDLVDGERQHGPRGAVAPALLVLPPGHPLSPVGGRFPELPFDLADLPVQVGQPHPLVGRIDDAGRLVVVVQEREEAVILLLRDRVELVRVALGALDRQAEDALADRLHPVEHRLHAELLGVDAPLLVDHRVAEEARRDDLILGGIRELVPGDLLDDEAVVGEVAVEGVDDPVAIEPDVPRLVLLEPVAVGVPGRVEPVPPPALAVMGARQEALDHLLVGILVPIGDEGIDLGNGRGQPDQVEAQAADQRDPVRLGRRLETFPLQAGQHEPIDRVPHPALIAGAGHGGTSRRVERPVVLRGARLPVVGPGRPLVDPGAEQADLLGRQPFLLLGGHGVVLLVGGHTLDQGAFGALAGQDRRPLGPSLEGRGLVVEPQIRLLLLRPVALVALRLEDRPDVLGEIDRPRDRRGQLRLALLGGGDGGSEAARRDRGDPGGMHNPARED